MRPDRLLAHLLTSDPARPRVTYYDDTEGPTRGERVELSAKVVGNWVNKAANLLQEEFDAGPGTRVALLLPAEHWRTVYWALAVWSVGATVASTDGDVVIGVAGEQVGSAGAPDIAVTLAALARQASAPTGTALDEAKELATYGDRFTPWATADDDAPALVTGDGTWSYGDLVEAAPTARRFVTGDLPSVLRSAASSFAADGSVVLVRNADPATLAQRLSAEGVDA